MKYVYEHSYYKTFFLLVLLITDVSLVASTIMYAFYLNETRKIGQFCTVPVINMKRADLSSHAEIKWLLNSSQIDQSSLIFLDEVCSILLFETLTVRLLCY